MTDKVLVQDEAAFNVADHDTNYAAYFGALTHAGRPVGCIVDGLALTNYAASTPSINVDAGTAVVTRASATDGSNISIDGQSVVAQLDARTGVSLTDGAVNELFVAVDTDALDNPRIVASTTGAPSDPSTKIGEVDTSNDTVSSQWYLLTDSGHLSFPTESDASSASSSLRAGTQLYDRTNDAYFKVI